MLAATKPEQSPLTKQLNTPDAVDRGRRRLDDGDHVRAWGASAACLGRPLRRARSRSRSPPSPRRCRPCRRWSCRSGAASSPNDDALFKDLASVETLGSTSAINSDKTGTLTHEPDDGGRGASIRPTATRSPARAMSSRGRSSTPRAPRTRSKTRSSLRHRQRRRRWSTGRWSVTPPRARCSCSATRRASTSTHTPERIRGWRRCPSTRPTS